MERGSNVEETNVDHGTHTMYTMHPFSGWETQIEQPESQKSLQPLWAKMHKNVQPLFLIPELTPEQLNSSIRIFKIFQVMCLAGLAKS